MDNYQLLLGKLDAFIRKYYKNQLIRGGIYAFTLGLAFYLLVATLEYFGNFSTGVRTALFWSFVAGMVFIFSKYIFIPLFHLYKIGDIISHEQAAQIIGQHFGEVKDKLLNVLQLKNQLTNSKLQTLNSELIEASINQKSYELQPIPFVKAINLNENRKYLRYAAIPFFILVIFLFTAPSLIKDSTKRLINHGTYFEKPAPFTFEVLNKELRAVQQQDFLLNVKVNGTEAPQEAYVQIDGNQFKLDKENRVNFHYTFKNLQKSIAFKLFADGFYSKEYKLEALPNPVLMNFEIALDYPAYLHKQNEKLQNTGDLVIPAGTKVSWLFNTQNTEALNLSFQDTTVAPNRSEENAFTFSKRFVKNDSYTVSTSNHYLQSKDSVRYTISVVPDLYPTISVEQQSDSISTKRTFFKGLIKDDYGFIKLSFNYHFLKSANDSSGIDKTKMVSEQIPVSRNTTTDQFFYNWDVTNVNVNAGDEIEYYFEVTDNDGLVGGKSTRSQTQIFKAPTLKQIEENTAKNNDNIKSELKESMDQAKQLQREIDDLQNKILDKKEMTWEDKKKLDELQKKQNELAQKMEDIKKDNAKNNEQKSEYKPIDPELLAKQQQLQDLINKLMTPELKKMMEELQKLMEQADKSQVQEQLDKMKLDNKELEKELARALELFKQMEFEQKLQDNIDKLKEMAQKQDDLSKQSEQKDADSKELKSKQDSMNKTFEDFRKDMDELGKKNEALEQPNNMENTDKQEEAVQQDQKESSEQLGDNKPGKASKSQKSAGQNMQQMADKMSAMQAQMEQEQQEEDMAALRALLENLLRLSFDQEKLMSDLKTMDINNPQYLKASQQQRKLKDDFKIVEDSLFALSKRVIQIEQKVNQEVKLINQNMDAALENLEGRMVPQARSREQFAMTSINNLTLMLSEALQQMQQAQVNAKPGSGVCKKPGSGMGKKPSLSELRKMQEELNKNMAKAKEQMKKEGGPKPGQKGKPGGMGVMSEQLAKMAAQQEYIRQQLQQLNLEENKDGQNKLGNLNAIQKQMEETENDIVNRMLSEQTLKRQQDILTRLLESEKAERERDQDEQRKSEQAKNYEQRNPPEFEEYKRLKLKEMELLRTVPPALNSYYKKKVNDYFQAIEK
jgi:hypothetical protein